MLARGWELEGRMETARGFYNFYPSNFRIRMKYIFTYKMHSGFRETSKALEKCMLLYLYLNG